MTDNQITKKDNDIKNEISSEAAGAAGETLWTKDFTIITMGSIVSMLGNVMAYFAISLFVLDYTDNGFYYALYVFLGTFPQIAAPVLAGPLMDRFSRRRTIYMLDYASAAIFMLVALIVRFDFFSFPILAVLTVLMGTINSTYMVAYDSFYPLLITKGFFTKAYSISSVLETMSMAVVVVATYFYKTFGLFPMMVANSICFLIAATFETRISDVEKNAPALEGNNYRIGDYIEDAREGIKYLISEKGLLLITVYFMFSNMSGGAEQVIVLPFFKRNFANGEYIFMSVMGFMLLGRVIGGMIHYKIKFPVDKKYIIAFIVYLVIGVCFGGLLYLPLWLMRVACFTSGILGVTSYNIRISSTQSYVPNEKRGRYNGAFIMLNTVGSMVGQLVAGALLVATSHRAVMLIINGLGILAAVILIGGGKKHIEPIYNRQS